MATEFGYGQATPWDVSSDFNVMAFIVKQMMARMDTMKLVRVEAVHGGGVATPATVDVLPLVQQVDGNGNATSIAKVFGIPCLRIQGGPCAIIIDPKVGDVGFVIISDRDISKIKADPSKPAPPGSFRKFDLADGVYVGGVLNAAPTCFVWLKPDGHLKIADAHGNVVETSSSGFALNGNVAVTGNITATGEITRGLGGGDQVTLGQHLHTSGGAGNPSSVPTAGT